MKKKTKKTKKTNPLTPVIVIDKITGTVCLEIFGRKIEGITFLSYKTSYNPRPLYEIGNREPISTVNGCLEINACIDLSALTMETR